LGSRAVDGSHRQHALGGHGGCPPVPALLDEGRELHVRDHVHAVIAVRIVSAETDGDPGGLHLGNRGYARAEEQVADRIVGDLDVEGLQRPDVAAACLNTVARQDLRPEEPDRSEVLDAGHSRLVAILRRLGQMQREPGAAPAGKILGSEQPLPAAEDRDAR
jgi:hypothetical protein